MIVLGLTGSIGMGKSTAAAMLERLGVPVHDSDAAARALLAPSGPAYAAVTRAFPGLRYPGLYGRRAKNGNRAINRHRLGEIVFADEQKRKKLESIIHPLVRKAQDDFIRRHKALRTGMIALDIPLLFETGAENRVDYILVVSAPAHVQRRRALERPGMDIKKLRAILSSQMPDGEKRARADYVVPTGLGRAATMRGLQAALRDIKKKQQKEKPRDVKKRARIRS